MIIGLTGYGRVGKNTAGEILVEDHDFVQMALADGVREAALAIDPIVASFGDVFIRLSELVEQYGWEGIKKDAPDSYRDEIRRILQRVGTEAGWKLHDPELWVRRLFARMPVDKSIVVTDVRFPHEADAIHGRGGYVVRLYREGVGPLNGHDSELLVDSVMSDYYLFNDGTIDALRVQIDDMMTVMPACS